MNNKSMSQAMKEVKRKPVHLINTVTSSLLSKYAPKYCKKLDAPLISGSLVSKVKKMKMLERLDSYCKKELRFELLKDKRRQVKTILPAEVTSSLRYFPNIPKYTLNILSKRLFRGFLLLRGIRTLTLAVPGNSRTKKCLKIFKWLFWKHLKNLKSLEHLKIIISSSFPKASYKFFKNFGSKYCDILEPLKSLEVDLELSSDCTISPKELFPLNFIGSLDALHVKYDSIYFKMGFTESIEYFNNINSLHLELLDTTHLDLKSLDVLHKLHKLDYFWLQIKLDSNSKWKAFLKNITFSPSLNDLVIELYNINWDDLIPNCLEQAFGANNPFDQDPSCIHFYDKWTQLHSLEALTLSFQPRENSVVSGAYFVLPILKKLSGLTEFHYLNEQHERRNKIQSVDFAWFLKEIAHLSSTLRVLEIEDSELSFENLTPDNLSCFNLENLEIFALISGDTKIGNLHKLFPGMRKNPSIKQTISLERVVIDSQYSLVLFLKSLRKLAHNKDLELEISIDVENLRMDQLHRRLVNYIKEGYIIQNLNLIIENANRQRIHWDDIEKLQDKHKTFKTLELGFEIDDNNYESFEEDVEESDLSETVGDLNYQ